MLTKFLGASLVLATLALGILPSSSAPQSGDDVSTPNLASVDRWAVVKKDGALVRGRGVVSVVRGGPLIDVPVYRVTFDKDVTTCGYVATVTDTGTASVRQGLNDTHAVMVYTRGLDGKRADIGFHLHVSCALQPKSTDDVWAVVSGSGSYIRGKGVDSVTRAEAGRYHVTFDRSVAGCPYVASLGLPGSTGDEPTGMLSVSPTADPKTVNVWVLSSGSTTYVDRGFHLFVGCDLTPGDRFANVNIAGDSVGGRGVQSVEHPEEGRYLVRFNRNVTTCLLNATIGLIPPGALPPGRISVARVKDEPRVVAVSTYFANEPLDRSFRLIVGCD
jgi:hypothetical protein